MIVENFDYNVVFSVYSYRAYAQIEDILKLVTHINGFELSPENLDDAWDKAARAIADRFPGLADIDLTYCNEYAAPEGLLDQVYDVLGDMVEIEGQGFVLPLSSGTLPAIRYA